MIEAVDQVANTASVYGAYLKKFKKSACKTLTLKPLQLVNHVAGCKVYNADANLLINSISSDILYIDPPYNHREYGANYHVLETVARYDSPALTGMTGLRDYSRSDFCKVKKAANAFENIIRAANTHHILVSYNDEGILPFEELQRLLALRGEPVIFKTEYNRFKADNGRLYKRDRTVEYVHYVRVVKSADAVA